LTFLQKYRETGFTSAKITATEIASAMSIKPKFREWCVKRKRNEEAMKNSPKKVFEADFCVMSCASEFHDTYHMI
jgi:hypothetical protein